jgi:hypothetical protein
VEGIIFVRTSHIKEDQFGDLPFSILPISNRCIFRISGLPVLDVLVKDVKKNSNEMCEAIFLMVCLFFRSPVVVLMAKKIMVCLFFRSPVFLWLAGAGARTPLSAFREVAATSRGRQ